MSDLPRYRCHKVVQAAKITTAVREETSEGLQRHEKTVVTYVLTLEVPGEVEPAFRVVSEKWFERNAELPAIGGYFVVYDDGYESWSPAEAFEKGYTLIDGEAQAHGTTPR